MHALCHWSVASSSVCHPVVRLLAFEEIMAGQSRICVACKHVQIGRLAGLPGTRQMLLTLHD